MFVKVKIALTFHVDMLEILRKYKDIYAVTNYGVTRDFILSTVYVLLTLINFI